MIGEVVLSLSATEAAAACSEWPLAPKPVLRVWTVGPQHIPARGTPGISAEPLQGKIVSGHTSSPDGPELRPGLPGDVPGGGWYPPSLPWTPGRVSLSPTSCLHQQWEWSGSQG